MGCGAIQVVPITPSLSLEQKLMSNIKNYSFNHILTEQQCKTILDHIQQENIPIYYQNNKLDNQNELITKFERSIWKIMLLKDTNIYKQYQFTHNPTAHNEKLTKQFQAISKDVSRTFPGLLNENNRLQLKIILENINLYFPNVGYTQGMNYFIGFFLLCGFNPEETFWIFINLSRSKDYLLIMNFSEGFPMTMYIISVFSKKLLQKFPKVHQKLEDHGINPHLYAFSWFLCYFLYCHHPKTCIKFWSYFIRNQGIGYILSISLAFISKYQNQIIQAGDSQTIIKLLQMRNQYQPLSEEFIDQIIKISMDFIIPKEELYEQETEFAKIHKSQEELQKAMQKYRN